MKIGVFDSGLGGLTVVSSIFKVFKNIEVFYVADTLYAPYGLKKQDEILTRSIQISEYLIKNYQIDALIIACNTATSASVEHLRLRYPNLIVIGMEPGLKPALALSKTNSIAVLATNATLNGEKYKKLLELLLEDKKSKISECACIGLVEQIEEGKIEDKKTFSMLEKWLSPMQKKQVDTVVLGCTHYPLISPLIKQIMGEEIKIVQTGNAIAKRLKTLSEEKEYQSEFLLNLNIHHTGNINKNMIEMIFKDIKIDKKTIRKCEI